MVKKGLCLNARFLWIFLCERIVLKVFLGKNKDFGHQTDPTGNWTKTYDSCTAIHPPWFNGVTGQDFREYCIRSAKQCKIYSLIYKGIKLRMKDYQNHNEILEVMQKL